MAHNNYSEMQNYYKEMYDNHKETQNILSLQHSFLCKATVDIMC